MESGDKGYRQENLTYFRLMTVVWELHFEGAASNRHFNWGKFRSSFSSFLNFWDENFQNWAKMSIWTHPACNTLEPLSNIITSDMFTISLYILVNNTIIPIFWPLFFFSHKSWNLFLTNSFLFPSNTPLIAPPFFPSEHYTFSSNHTHSFDIPYNITSLPLPLYPPLPLHSPSTPPL